MDSTELQDLDSLLMCLCRLFLQELPTTANKCYTLKDSIPA